MQTIRITTSQNIDIDYEIAGVGERIVARIIDSAIFIVIVVAILVTGSVSGNIGSGTGALFIFLYVIGFLYVFYDLACEVLMNGQSIGKRTMKIKVISLDGGQPSLGQYLLRWLFRVVDFTMTGGLCALISVSVSKNSQRVGDMVAGTSLIKTTSRTSMDAIAFSMHNDDYKPAFTQVTQLNDKDIVLMHEVLTNYIKSGNGDVLTITANKLKGLLAINTEMDDMHFLQTLIRDYNHIAAVGQTI